MTVTMIPSKKQQLPVNVMSPAERRKTAGYARVSTNEEEQQTSYEAQVDYYTKMIQANPEWEFIDVYTDDGISATSTKKRSGFNQMVEDALAGKIQLIITNAVITKGQFYNDPKLPLLSLRVFNFEARVLMAPLWHETQIKFKKTFQRGLQKGKFRVILYSSVAQ